MERSGWAEKMDIALCKAAIRQFEECNPAFWDEFKSKKWQKRDFIMSLGVFVDGGGADKYFERQAAEALPASFGFCGDGKAWSRPGASNPPLPGEHGCGIDAP